MDAEVMVDYLGRRDPKLLSYPMMESPRPTVILSVLYLAFVLMIGPDFMKKRKPMDLRIPMFVYNMSLVVLNLWVVVNIFIHGWSVYNWRCEPIDFSYSERAQKITQVCWVIYFSKILEYFDTVFFVLRKKDKQINFLHVFHHCTVPVTSWYGITYGPGGYNMAFPTANPFVHIWMYLYYGLAALGPGVQKYLWWKKYITKLQLIQFVFVTGYFCQLCLFPKEGCDVNPFLVWLSLVQAMVYLGLFTHFYFKSYKSHPQKESNSSTQKESNGSPQKESIDHQNNLIHSKVKNGNYNTDKRKTQ